MKVSDMFPDRKPQQVVKQPIRKSESSGKWVGVIREIKEESGIVPPKMGKDKKMLKARPWTLYTIVGIDGAQFITFSSTDKMLATAAYDELVEIEWEDTGRDSRKFLGIQPATPEDKS